MKYYLLQQQPMIYMRELNSLADDNPLALLAGVRVWFVVQLPPFFKDYTLVHSGIVSDLTLLCTVDDWVHYHHSLH